MVHSILAVDLGSESITAAVVTAAAVPDPAVLYLGAQPSVGAHVFVDVAGELQPATFQGVSSVKIAGIASSLGKPPRVIADAPRAGTSMVAVAVSPLVARAEHYFQGPLDAIAATHPAHWSDAKLDDYSHALARYAGTVTLIPWDAAIAAQTRVSDVDRPVISVDFGAAVASVTVVGADGRPLADAEASDPAGGARALDRHIAEVVAQATAHDSSPFDRRWWADAAAEAGRVRIAAAAAESVRAMFPDPIGSMALTSDDVHQVSARYMQDAVSALVSRTPGLEALAHGGHRVELTGGLALDRAVQDAVRAVIGQPTVVPDPAHAAAYGAALIAARAFAPNGAAEPPEPPRKTGRIARWGRRR